jgi:hypothetical protein
LIDKEFDWLDSDDDLEEDDLELDEELPLEDEDNEDADDEDDIDNDLDDDDDDIEVDLDSDDNSVTTADVGKLESIEEASAKLAWKEDNLDVPVSHNYVEDKSEEHSELYMSTVIQILQPVSQTSMDYIYKQLRSTKGTLCVVGEVELMKLTETQVIDITEDMI